MITKTLLVLKFGSSVLRSTEDLPTAVHEIYRHVREGKRVVAVVSAFGNTTQELIEQANSFHQNPTPAVLATLVSTGEQNASAFLSLALSRAGIPNTLQLSPQCSLQTEGPLLDATPVAFDVEECLAQLEQKPVVVLPGFVGRSQEGTVSLLGRGGSDLSALFIAHQLKANSCHLLKDVHGIYESDPATSEHPPRHFETLTWEEAEQLDAKVVQPKALAFAKTNKLSFVVTAPGALLATRVGEQTAQPASTIKTRNNPVRVTILGLGTVGLGVYRLLANHPKKFQVVRIAIRDRSKHQHVDIPQSLLTTNPWEALHTPSDLVIEVMGGRKLATRLINRALTTGRDVVTANKDVIAHHGPWLERIAELSDTTLLYSASVGGVVPMIETIRRVASKGTLQAFQGVLNGTTNFILSQLTRGDCFAEAVRKAQEEGFAEADPTADLAGIDAANKLSILIRHAFNQIFRPGEFECIGIEHLNKDIIQQSESKGETIRLVATCTRTSSGVKAEVKPIRLPKDHPLAKTSGAENRLLIKEACGQTTLLQGQGAGRWPTAESVFADLQTLYHQRQHTQLASA